MCAISGYAGSNYICFMSVINASEKLSINEWMNFLQLAVVVFYYYYYYYYYYYSFICLITHLHYNRVLQMDS